jgi:predicted ATPase/class 3 adenylate cyclase/DNA-binding CsgD family transcriptional regulator
VPGLPTGTVTFLFTDIEGSTRLLEQLGDRYADLLAGYRRLLRAAFQKPAAQEIDTQGDALFVAFSRAKDAVATAVAAQVSISAHSWPEGAALRVRMGLHTGEPLSVETGYVGLDVHRAARICAAGHGGQILLSGTTRELVQSDLPEGTGLRDLGPHRLKDLAQPQHLFQLVAPGLANDFPPLKTLDTLPNNLPRQLTSFVGREREIGEVRRLLTTTSLLTLTGAGGSGKTRLALHVAADVLDQYPDGVWQVELASIADPTLVPQMVASALSVPEQPGRSLTETIVDHLRPKSTLLVLDNCEHLLSNCARFAAALLQACPRLRIMATSREGLGIGGELTYPVPSLSFPEPKQRPSLEQLMHYEAVRLFVERAAFSRPQFAVTSGNVSSVVQVCAQLDGIPLALELAAARVKVLAVEQIAARLRDRFQLLTGGGRTAPARHQTLRAAMDWSYDLLSENERALLRRLSVFAGGWTLEAAEAISSGNGVEASDILDLLTSLVDKSLVTVETQDGEARYRLLETVRQYGRDRLLAAGDAIEVRQRHRGWYLRLAEQADFMLRGPEQALWARRLEAEHDNLRAALEWSTQGESNPEPGLQLAWSLMWFWNTCGYVIEGRQWLEKMVPRASGASPSLQARVLCGAGALSEKLGEYEHARARLAGSLDLFRRLDDAGGAAFALHFLGHVASAQNDLALATRMFEESLALSRGAGDTWGCALTLDCWGSAASRQGDYDLASSLFAESAALFRDQGSRWEVYGPVSGLGVVAAARGDDVRAKALLEEGLAMARETGRKAAILTATLRLGRIAFAQGDRERAAALFKESLVLRKERGDKDGIAACLDALAGVAVTQERPERAARLFGAADVLRETIHTVVPPAQRAEYDRHMSTLRAHLDETALGAAWAAGRAMTLEQAIEDALALDEASPHPGKKAERPAPAERLGLLTAREREVAALIAQGLTNREIASRLVIAERTAEGHVQGILNKLGFNSRAQIAAWAVQQGLDVESH